MDQSMQLSLPLPRSVDTRIYIHLTVKARAIVLFLTTASAEEVGTLTPMGSFVYALPDVRPSSSLSPLSSPVFADPPAETVVEIQSSPTTLNLVEHR